MFYRFVSAIILLWVFAFNVFTVSAQESADHKDDYDPSARPVLISFDEDGLLRVWDKGKYFSQYIVRTPEKSAHAEIVKEYEQKELEGKAASRIVIVVHGWVDKGIGSWPNFVAKSISDELKTKGWLVGYFDWHGGSFVMNPTNAATYGKTIAGYRLADSIKELGIKFEHIHLIGHSAGSWTINSAALQLHDDFPEADMHLTFLDAYIPNHWDQSELGELPIDDTYGLWIEHYYTEDGTGKVTETLLENAQNINLIDIEPGANEHKFPFRWYQATVVGEYQMDWREKNSTLYCESGLLKYGFERSLEAGEENWEKSLLLEVDTLPLTLSKPAEEKKAFGFLDSLLGKK